MLLVLHFVEYAAINPLSYASVMFVDGGMYGLRTALMLAVITTTLELRNGKMSRCYMAAVAVGAFVCGLSSGNYLIATTIAPLLFWWIVEYYSTREVPNVKITLTWLIFLGIIAMTGAVYARHIWGYSSSDATLLLVTLGNFWDNFGAAFLGFLKVQSALPTEKVPILSSNGILYLMYFSAALVMLTALVTKIKDMGKMSAEWRLSAIFIIVNFFILVLSQNRYGNLPEERYFIPIVVIGYIFMADFIGRFLEKFRIGLPVVLMLALLVMNFTSARTYLHAHNDCESLQIVASELDKREPSVVCVFGKYASALMVDYARLVALDRNKLYKFTFPIDADVQKFIDVTYPNGFRLRNHIQAVWEDYAIFRLYTPLRENEAVEECRNILILTLPEYAADLPEHIRARAHMVNENVRGYMVMEITEQ